MEPFGVHFGITARMAALLLVCLTARASQPGEERLLLKPLISQALRRNPEILAAQKRYESLRQRPGRESSLPDPMLSFGYSSAGSPRPLAGIGEQPVSNAGMMISQEFPFPGKRRLRGDIASKEAEAAFQEYLAVQLNVLSRLKQAYYRLHYAYEAIAVMERNRELLVKFLRIAEIRYSVGKAVQQDLFKIQTQLSILDSRIERMEREKRSAEAEINSLLARPPNTGWPRPPAIASGPLRFGLDELNSLADTNSPLLRREEKMIQRSELALNLARKEHYPDYTLSAGYFNMGRMPDMYQFRLDLKLPVYWWRKQRAGVAEEAHNLSQARQSLEAADQGVRFRIKDSYLMAHTSRRLMSLYAGEVIPQASLALESSLASYETGAVDLLTVLSNFMTVVEFEGNYQEELLNYLIALARLEELTGTDLVDWID